MLTNRKTLFLAYNEKSSSPFSWFPTRSPRHCTAKSLPCPVSSTAPTQPANTLKSLTANTEDLIPLFVKMCIKYIEEVSSALFNIFICICKCR